MSNSRLSGALGTLKHQIEARQQARRNERIEKGKLERDISSGGVHHVIGISPDVAAFFGAVVASVHAEKMRYLTEADAEAPSSAPSPADAPIPLTGEDLGEAPADIPTLDPATPIHDLVVRGPIPGLTPSKPLKPSEQVAAVAVAAQHISSIHLRPLIDRWEPHSHVLPMVGHEHLSTPARHCLAFMSHELAVMTEEQTQKGAVPPALMAKLKQAVNAFAESRISDTITLLRNALNGDPHNHCLLAILSQVLYFVAARERTVLPEAREVAQKSLIFSDKIRPQQLELYRYLAIVTELAFDPARTMDWLRESRLLDPAVMCTKDGLLVSEGLRLRAWAILAQIPVSLWTENEFHAVKHLMTHAVGGGALYLVWFRGMLVEANTISKLPLPDVEEMERMIFTSLAFHEESSLALRQLPLRNSPFPWFLRARYMNTFAQLVQIPNFDQVLCMIALSGQAHMENVFPDNELCTLLDDPSLSYWNTWALVLTPFKDVRQPYLMPAEETVRDASLLTSCDTLLAALQEAEKQRVKANLWEDLKPWMTRWQLEHLLAAGTGSNKPRSRFTPNLIPYTHFYRRWQDPLPISPLASEVIAETARRGCFASLFEIIAAFEGAARLLDDPVHGLVPGQKRALEAAKRNNPSRFPAVSADFAPQGSNFLLFLLPVGTLGAVAAIIEMSANWSQAIGLMLALAGLAGVIALNIKK